MSHGSHEGDHAMAQQYYSMNEGYANGYQNNGAYYTQASGQYTQQQHAHIPTVASAPSFYNNPNNNSPLRKPSPIRRTQSFEVEETDFKLIKRRSQTQINSPNLPRAPNRGSRSNSSNNISPPQRQQGPSSPDHRARSLSQRGSSPARSTSPSNRGIVNVITRPDANLCKAICATLTASNKNTETLAIELGNRSLLPEINAFLSGVERADGWSHIEKLLIDWMILQNTSSVIQSPPQQSTSSAINHEAAIITNPKQNPVVSASPGKSDHWTVDSEEPITTKYFLGTQMSSSQNPYYSSSQHGTWAPPSQHPNQTQKFVDNYQHNPNVNQNGYREPIQPHSQINNFPRSPEKNSAQQIPMQRQQYMNGSPREDERPQLSPPSWQPQNHRPTPNPQPIYSSPRDQNAAPTEKHYPAVQASANGFQANNMYINQQPHKMPQAQAPHLQQPASHHHHHANVAPHLRNSANFEGNYHNEQQMAQLSIAESTQNSRNPFYAPYDQNYGYEYLPMEANETHQQPQPIVNSNQGAVMRRY